MANKLENTKLKSHLKASSAKTERRMDDDGVVTENMLNIKTNPILHFFGSKILLLCKIRLLSYRSDFAVR